MYEDFKGVFTPILTFPPARGKGLKRGRGVVKAGSLDSSAALRSARNDREKQGRSE